MSTFIVVAALMAAIAAAAVAYPLLRDRRNRLIGLLAAFVVAGAAAALYPLWSNYNWRSPPGSPATANPDIAAMLGKLEQHLKDEPTDQQGWIMLGRSYGVLERIDDSIRAYQRAHELGPNADASIGLGEALSVREGGEIPDAANKLFEEGFMLAPTNPKALFYGGYAALLRGDRALARERWVTLKDMHPPAQVEQMLDARIAELSESPGGTNPSPAGTSSSGETSAAAEVTVNIAIAPALKAQVKQDTPLFLFAREPGGGGPPLAAKRLTAAVIGTQVRLSSADSMIPGRVLKSGQTVSITARLSFAGTPTPAAGDLYGDKVVQVGESGAIDVLIDRVAQ